MFCKNIFVADLLGSQYFFEILQTSLNVKNGENMSKSGCFKKCFLWGAPVFFEMKEGYKVSSVKYWYFDKLLGGWYLFEIYSTPHPLWKLLKLW